MINPIELNTDELYYSDEKYMSVSSFKKYQKCEVDGKKGFSGEMSDAMLIGSYVDAYISGTLDKFKEDHPEIISGQGKTKGELKTAYKNADLICEFITKDKVFSQFMSGEKQTIMTGAISGVPWKIKMDSYSPHIAINDLKVMATVTDRIGNFYDFITPWGYDIQLACYQEIVFQNTGERLPCFICAVTKEVPINSVIISIPQVYLDRALYRVSSQVEHFNAIKLGEVEPIGCGICKTCIDARTETQIISLSDLTE